jgi:uncharacterized membrane protein
MREWLVFISEHAILIIDAMALVVILFGTVEAFVRSICLAFVRASGPQRREVWLRFARWLVAGLTFQLAADIIETSITTSWDALGRIAVIAAIRTALNYFLDRDVAEISARQRETANP